MLWWCRLRVYHLLVKWFCARQSGTSCLDMSRPEITEKLLGMSCQKWWDCITVVVQVCCSSPQHLENWRSCKLRAIVGMLMTHKCMVR